MTPNNDQGPKIQSRIYREFSSKTKTIIVHLANFKYNHKDNPSDDDIYINRKSIENKLESWLTSSSKLGSYLVAGYRGMGKSSLVNHILNRITREKNPMIESIYRASIFFFILYFVSRLQGWHAIQLLSILIALGCSGAVIWNYHAVKTDIHRTIRRFRHKRLFSALQISKALQLFEPNEKRYNRIKIKINLGKEVMNERDVLCLITEHIKVHYADYIHTGQNRPVWCYFRIIVCCIAALLLVQHLIYPIFQPIETQAVTFPEKTFFIAFLWRSIIFHAKELQQNACVDFIYTVIAYSGAYVFCHFVFQKILALFDKSEYCIRELENLSDKLSASVSESDGNLPNITNRFLNISFFSRKQKENPIANIRDIETELTRIINTLNSKECIHVNRVQFLVVLDELDKVEHSREDNKNSREITPPDFTTAIDGFSGDITNSDRRKTILQLLANMKLFLTSAKAKFIFISGRELYEAYLADLSDREYAISSIFSGVINVNSFLHPEQEQSDISSMTEQYIAELLLPKTYLSEQMERNIRENDTLKPEWPSLRWYTQYLTELAQQDDSYDIEHRLMEIRHTITFLHYFTVYLSHVSNGSPKKIMLYFEKYVKRRTECIQLTDWDDTLECGRPDKYALYFSPQDQQKIGFIFYLAAPIMDAVTSYASNYDDKLLVSASFIVDHLFKFHGKSFSWRNIEQIPELLDVNKTADIREFIVSIVNFMQHIHLSSIMVGLFQFKFRKRISEEIAYISHISDEAAAMFNFTLNESQSVKQHNIKLLNYFIELNRASRRDDTPKASGIYDGTIARLHATLADLYFQEEDYSRAIEEYRNALNILERDSNMDKPEPPSTTITRIRCMLKMGLTCEYRKTYDTAYVIYCRLVDAMISFREVDERKIGLDIIDTWTNDWRIKQPMIVDYGVRRIDDTKHPLRATASVETGGQTITDPPQDEYHTRYRDQFINGLWDDGIENTGTSYNFKSYYHPAEYSLDFDNMISGFAKNLSPEKSRFIANLSMFEDLRLIYKAILAKLFILEKMNMSGITQANIDIAEAEFKYLHRTINIKEKFFISADFFNQLGKILYYKNNLGIVSGISGKPNRESARSTLYWWNIDLLAYLDDFCFHLHHLSPDNDAILIKKEVKEDLNAIYWKDIRNQVKTIQTKHPAYTDKDVLIEALKKQADNIFTHKYLEYIRDRIPAQKAISIKKIDECSQARCEMCEQGWDLPCYACKYYNQSIHILMEHMFINHDRKDLGEQYLPGSKALFLLRNTFRKKLRYTRINHLRLLATNIVSLGNTMVSCAKEKVISRKALEIVSQLMEDGRDTKKLSQLSDQIYQQINFSKLDKALLYYLAAYRFYNIANQSKDACDCIYKILSVLNEYITICNFDKKSPDGLSAKEKRSIEECSNYLSREDNLLDLLFTRYAKAISEQFDYGSISEVYDYKWIFHMNKTEDLHLKRIQIYSGLQEIIWQIMDIRIKLLNLQSYYQRIDKSISDDFYKEKKARFRKAVMEAYKHFNTPYRISDTFYNEVITNYAKFRLGKWALKDILGQDPMVDQQNSHVYDPIFAIQFIRLLEKYLKKTIPSERLDHILFHIEDTHRAKLELIEFLLENGIVCLTDILYILTPYNQTSSFTNSFIADVYSQLWEYSKMYETLIHLYEYKQKRDIKGIDMIFETLGEAKLNDLQLLKSVFNSCCPYIEENPDLAERYGQLSHRFETRIRHHIDDRTIHHVLSNYAAEMALHYYKEVEQSHSEGITYKNQINRNYILNDDLDNDTWLFNTTIERFRLHTGYIHNHRRRLVKLCSQSRYYKMDNYVHSNESRFAEFYDSIRYEDSLHTNSELL